MSIRNAVRDGALTRYRNIDTIWRHDDQWHMHTHAAIQSFITSTRHVAIGQHHDTRILNVGSAGEDYGLMPDRQTHVDLVDRFIKSKDRYVVASAEDLPFDARMFHSVLCVGSVLNYCSASEAISEFLRVLVHGGSLILEFETSSSFEFIGTDVYNRDVSIVNTFYQGSQERIWVYSQAYILRLLRDRGFHVQLTKCVHTLSSLALRMGANAITASRWAHCDRFVSSVPWLRHHGCNIILLCRKFVA